MGAGYSTLQLVDFDKKSGSLGSALCEHESYQGARYRQCTISLCTFPVSKNAVFSFAR